MESPTNTPLLRLHPAPVEPIDVRTAYDVERPRLDERPWIAVCMIASLDGSVAVEGTSGGLGNANDLAVLLTLRDLADVVIVGAGTARHEGYGPPRRAGLRVGLVTRSGSVDLDSELFTSGSGFVIAPESAPIDDDAVDVIRAGTTDVDLGAAVARLRELIPTCELVTAEGGPRLNGSLLDAGLVDELNLTLSPHLVGGDGPRVTAGAGGAMEHYDLAHLLTDDEGFVFGRWARPA